MGANMKKSIVILLVMVLIFSLLACGNRLAGQEEKNETSTEETELTEVSKEQGETQKTDESKKEPEKLNATHFDNLPKVAEQVGFSFRAPEKFSNDYSFSSFSIVELQDKDEKGQKIGEKYTAVKLNYKFSNNVYTSTITLYPKEEAIIPPPTYVSTKDIDGIDVSLLEYILRMVDDDFEYTDEDAAWEAQGKGSISKDGVTVGDVYYRTLYWEEDGIYYEIQAGVGDMPVEELETMMKEVIQSEYK